MPDLPLGAVIAFDFQSWNVQEEIAILRQVGIRRVQVWRNYSQGITARHVRETLEAAGLAADSLHGYFQLDPGDRPGSDLSSPDAQVRQDVIEILRREAEFARAIGCRDIVVHPVAPGQTADDPCRPGGLTAAVAALAEIGRRDDVRFLVENMSPPMFGSDARVLRQAVDEAGGRHVGLNYDSGHAMLAGDPVGAVRAMGPRLWGVHLHDNLGSKDDHMIPGTGCVPLEEIARALAEVGYGGIFMLEVYRPTDEVRRDLTPERLAFIERLRRLASAL
jgi:sugar phosphate isomerase/epimerase